MTVQLYEEHDRRVDIVNDLAVRIAVMERSHEEEVKVRLEHASIISKLAERDSALAEAIHNVSSQLDKLIGQIGVSMKLLLVLGAVCTSVITGAWVYSQDLSNRITAGNATSLNNSQANHRDIMKMER